MERLPGAITDDGWLSDARACSPPPSLSTALGRQSLRVWYGKANLQKEEKPSHENPCSVGCVSPRFVCSNHGCCPESGKRCTALDPKYGWIFATRRIRQPNSFRSWSIQQPLRQRSCHRCLCFAGGIADRLRSWRFLRDQPDAWRVRVCG